MNAQQCRYCLAAWGDIGLPCDDHGEREASVARQVAKLIHKKEPTDEQVGWFMQDAEFICAVVDDPEPVVRRWEARTMRLYVGEAVFKVEDEGGLTLVRERPR